MGAFKEPHGGELKNLFLTGDDVEAEKTRARDMTSWDLTDRQICDIELILNGGFSPLEGFLDQADYDSVVNDMRLVNKLLWPMPITLDVTQAFADEIKTGEEIALRDPEGVLIATMKIDDIWTPDRALEAKHVYGTNDEYHPAVHYLMNQSNPVYVGGRLRGVEKPMHYDFRHLRDSPQELRNLPVRQKRTC